MSQKKYQQTDYAHFLEVDVRDLWWNNDFTKLLFEKRANLSNVKKALDIGCGMGHWTQTFSPFLAPNAHVIGIDISEKWVEKAKKKSASFKRKDISFDFQKANATSLPFPDETFDLVTCQTLLMHLDNPQKAISEMMRVLKKRGKIILVEANNYVHVVRSNTAQESLSIAEQADYLKLYLLVEEGKRKEKEGFRNISAFLPGFLEKEDCKHIKSYRSDTSFSLTPPYKTKEQKTMISFILSLVEKDYFYGFSSEDTKRFFNTSCGDIDLFKKLIKTSQKLNKAYIQQIKEKTLAGMFAGELMITMGEKP